MAHSRGDAPRSRRELAGAVAAVVVPAAIAGLVVALLAPSGADDRPSASASGAAASLAERAGGGEGHVELSALPAASRGPGERGAPSERSARPAPPARIRVAGTEIRAPLVPVRARGERIRVPSPARGGWFADGPRPGEPGHAVVIGHRDSVEGPAVFTDVRSIGRDDLVTVTDRRGERHRYRVVGTTDVRKTAFPADEVYQRSRRPVLVLVTCGGDYDQDTGYEDNVLVYARAA